MNLSLADRIARAVLYEGYILYPYRPSVKNRQRWTFGGLYPRAFSEAQTGSDRWTIQSQCLVEGGPQTRVEARVRFLHLQQRTVGELPAPLDRLPADAEPRYRPVETLRIGERRYQSWQEAVEREVVVDGVSLDELSDHPRRRAFTLAAGREVEPLRDAEDRVVGLLVRERQALRGEVELAAETVAEGIFRVTTRVLNHTPWGGGASPDRDQALLRSMVSTHILLTADGGAFVSLMDPPEPCHRAVADCRNLGCWPVLVGEEGERDMMLCSPIILYDYPEIAPESPGDLFDAAEIDEILTLRIMTLTDEEKREMASVDDRARTLLERTEMLARDQLMSLHGMMKSSDPETREADRLYASAGATPGPPSPPSRSDGNGPAAASEVSPKPRLIRVAGVELRRGDRVRLQPRRRADAFDVVLRGEVATIEEIERDYEDRIHIAVTIDADPGKDLGRDGKIAHRFFFGADEVEPLP